MRTFKPPFLHAAATIAWLLLAEEPSFLDFGAGLLLGFAILFLFRDLFHARDYVRRWLGFARFLVAFSAAFLRSNAGVAWIVLTRPRRDIHPNFVEYDVSSLTSAEIMILSHCITLTPGTTSAQVDDGLSILTVHALDARDPEAVRRSIRTELEERILRFTR